MKRFLSILVLGLTFSLPAMARDLPKNMEVAYMKSAQYPTVQLSSGGFSWMKLLTLGLADNAQTFNLTHGIRIRNQKHTFLTRSELSNFGGHFIAFKRNRRNQIQEIWILNDHEVDTFRQRAAERGNLH